MNRTAMINRPTVLTVPDQETAALHAPVAPYTWEHQVVLISPNIETTRIPINWNRPVEIMGFFPSVIVNGVPLGGTRRVPTVNDIMILFDINMQDRLTNRLESTSAAGPGQAYVTLATFAVLVPRLIRIQINNAAPDVGVQFRWAQDPAPGGVPIYENAMIKLAYFCRYLDEVA